MNNIDLRIKELRRLMSENDISFYIIPTSDPHGSEYIDDHYKIREYMTGFSGSAGTLVVSDNEAALFVDGRYHIQAENETKDTCISIYKLGIKGVPGYVQYIKERANEDDLVAFDGRIFTENHYRNLQNEITNVNFECESDLMSELATDLPSRRANKIFGLSLDICGESVESKLSKIRIFLGDNNADGMFISSLDDVCYLFNIRGSDIRYSTVAFSYAYVTKDSATLYLQKDTYDDDITESLENSGVFIADYDDIETELFKIKGKTVLLDDEYTSAYFTKILKIGNEVKYIRNYEAIKKHIKNDTEQEIARKYAIVDAVSVIEFIAQLKTILPDSSYDLDEAGAGGLLTSIRANKQGFYALSFANICAYAENAAIVHYSAPEKGSKKIEQRGLLLVDSGAHYIGATTDITRTFVLGDITEEEKKAYTLVLKGNLKLMDATFIKGTRCENLDILARESLWKEGLDYRHGTGHGIGSFLNVHEGPYRIGYKIIDDMPQPIIEPGMIISDEPGYYEDGKFGIRLETQLLCVKRAETEYGTFYGFEPLSLVPFEKDAIMIELLNEEERQTLKRYSELIREKVRPALSASGKKWLDYNTNFVDWF